MKKPSQSTERAARIYAMLLKLYPHAHRQEFGDQMLRTFKDRHSDLSAHSEKTGGMYWLALIGDELISLSKEWIVGLHLKQLLPKVVLFAALALVVSSFFWIDGFIVYVKIPSVLLLLVGFVVLQTRPVDNTPRQAAQHVWRREGLRNGSILGLLWVVLNLLGNLSSNNSTESTMAKLLDVGILLIGLPILLGVAGFVSGRRSGSIFDGTFAAVLAAIAGSVIMLLSLVLIMLIFWTTVRDNAFQSAEMIRAWHASGDKTFGHYLWVDNLNGVLAYALIALIFGALLGTLGGALGAARHESGDASQRKRLNAGDKFA